MTHRRSVAQEPVAMTMSGYEVVEKVAKKCASSARILVPRHLNSGNSYGLQRLARPVSS